jgi:hypothetical protein
MRHAVAQLRHCATNRKVAGSITDDVTGIFHSDRTMALGYNVSNRNEYQEYFPGGKGGRCVGLTLPHARADCHVIWEPQPPGTSGSVQRLLYLFQNQTTVDTNSKPRLAVVQTRN